MEVHSSKKRLLLVGATKDSVHLKNYYDLIKDYFDEILVVTNHPIDFCSYKIVDFSIKNPFRILRNIKRFREIIKFFGPSIIHSHQTNSVSYFTVRANQKKYPVILTAWGSDVLLLPNKSFLFKKLVKYTLKQADIITADARFVAQEIKNLGFKKEVVIANFGIDYEKTVIPQKENIIYSNRLHNDLYNIDKIIIAFSDFVKEFPDWKLILGANGKNTESLKMMAKKILPESSYNFIGFVNKEENKKQFLRSRIWTSIPSSDGTSISLLEAMGYGCMPVVSDLPANHEWIINGENGVIVKNNVCEAMKLALNLPLEKVQEINTKIILSKATKKVNKAIFESAYDQLIKA